MKVAYKNSEPPAPEKQHFSQWFREVKQLEEKDPDRAIREYENMRKPFPLREEIYDRLMILFRKSKRYRDEIKLINEAITIFKAALPVKKIPPRIVKISRLILKSTGLTDKKGEALYPVQPFGRWQKRKELLEAKLKKVKDQD